jgi:CRP/FNR family transcriptional regulator, nitrogen oxide reductase regulator
MHYETTSARKHRHSLLHPMLDGDIQSKFLEGLNSIERSDIIQASSYRRFSHVSVPAHERDPATHLFLLIKGSARFFFLTPSGRQVYLLWLEPGDIFGGAALLSQPTTFLVSTEVAKDAHVLVWTRDVMRTLARRYSRLLENLLAITHDYILWYLGTHLSLVSYTARQRLANVLLNLAHRRGQGSLLNASLEITNEQLANTANITQFTVSRLLSEWRRCGAITKTRGKLVLTRPELLQTNLRVLG